MAALGTLAAFLLLIILPPGLAELQAGRCSANGDARVTELLKEMLQSFNPADIPNPSILLALRLASDHNLAIESAMIQRLKEDAVHRVQNDLDFSSGAVALYVMALQASCENPRKVSAFNATIDLLRILNNKYGEELNSITLHGQPLTSYFQLGLDVMALYMQNIYVCVDDILRVSCSQGSGESHSVDTASVLALGLTCVANKKDSNPKLKLEPVKTALSCLVQTILSGKQADGVIGNIYSTGLAMQALFVTQEYYPPSSWSCSQTQSAVLDAVSQGDFNNPMAASQITPSLEGRSYLDSKGLNCSADPDNLLIPTPRPPTDPSTSSITVSYRAVDGVSHSFDNSITVSVPAGSNFLKVMEEAQSLNPLQFSFTTISSSWGPYLVSVNGLASSNAARTYWQLQSGGTPLMQGVADYKPSAGEQLEANFTTY